MTENTMRAHILAAQSGSDESCAALYATFRPMAYAVGRRYLYRYPHHLDDFKHDAAVNALLKVIALYDTIHPGKMQQFVYGILRHEAFDHLQYWTSQMRSAEMVGLDAAMDAEGAEPSAERVAVAKNLVAHYLKPMKRAHRETLIARYCTGAEIDDIAATRGTTREQARCHLSWLRQKVKRLGRSAMRQ